MSTSEHVLECVRPPKDNRVLGYKGVTQKLRKAITVQMQLKYGPCPNRRGYKYFRALIKVALYLDKLSRGDQGPTKMCGELLKEFCHYVGFP